MLRDTMYYTTHNVCMIMHIMCLAFNTSREIVHGLKMHVEIPEVHIS